MYDDFGFVDLLSIDKLTERRLFLLLEHFKNPLTIANACYQELFEIVGQDIAHRILNYKRGEAVERKNEICQKLDIDIIAYNSNKYPAWLKDIALFPPVLFVRGMIKSDDEISIGVVGTRGATVYGKSIAERFAGDFARTGITVVSGMARGIDTMAHIGALKNKGRTIAVLGCGIDRCYPPENSKLMEEIIENGAVISEFNIGTPPLAHNFPKRNRIVSGLSKAIVAIEAKEKSGVMNTVNWALDQNKEVFAIPGNIYSKTSTGTNRLIKDGATPVTTVDEILESLGIKYIKKEIEVKKITLNETEKKVWDRLSVEPTYLDVLSEIMEEPTGSILNILLNLEIKGLVKQLPGMMFVKNIE
jgi:DNA processing protein